MGVGQVGKTDEKSTFALTSVIGKQNMGEFRQDAATEIQEKSPFFGTSQQRPPATGRRYGKRPYSQRSDSQLITHNWTWFQGWVAAAHYERNPH
jgi:hypothetical protein